MTHAALAGHPFGTVITEETLKQTFAPLSQWEDKYRQLILLGKQLPTLSDDLKAQAKEIERLRAQIVHGRWIYDEKAQRPYCSVCKEYFYGATNSSMNYCSNCGAKMDGKNG